MDLEPDSRPPEPEGDSGSPEPERPERFIDRIRTRILNRKEREETSSSGQEAPQKVRFFRRVGGARPISPLKMKVVRAKRKTRAFFQDHPGLSSGVSQVGMLLLMAVSAFIFAYGFRAFVSPSRVPYEYLSSDLQDLYDQASYNALSITDAEALMAPTKLISGGASGISQIIVRIFVLCGVSGISQTTLQSIFYLVVNIPIIVLGFLKVGKKFTFYSLINVILSSIFMEVIPASWCEVFMVYEDNVARALAGGLCTGIATSIALLANASTGGVDIISMFIAERKSTTMGRYSVYINACIVVLFTVLCAIPGPSDASDLATTQVTMSLYSLIYFFLSSTVIDALNVKNKKTQLQVYTSNTNMSKVLVRGFPHACTIMDGKGGYSSKDLSVISIVVSNSEVKKAVRIMRQVDPKCFITALATKQVYGKFYVRPIK